MVVVKLLVRSLMSCQLKVLDQACSVFDIVDFQYLNHTHGFYFGIT